MQQHDSNTLIYEEKQRLHMLEREEVVPRYISTSLRYYRKDHENEEFEQKAQNFEPSIHYMVEQETITRGIKMSIGVELVFVTK
jgi:hypothetical protein